METTVELISEALGGLRQSFNLAHAERILKLDNSGWSIPDNSEFKYENGTIFKPEPDTRAVSRSK